VPGQTQNAAGNTANGPFAEIGADAPDAARILREVEARAGADGPADSTGADGAALDIKSLDDDAELVRRVIRQMQRTGGLDIGDFDIPPGAGLLGRLESLAKRALWKLLRFYTYRMFTQQRDFNRQTAAVLDALWRRQCGRNAGDPRGRRP
jgi:hypothetical protein